MIYSDVLLNEEVSAQHFETAYKDIQYFREQRKKIYFQIADILKKIVPNKAMILDVGGAQGHLGSIIKDFCPNVIITINDLSIKACEYAKRTFGFSTICGSLANLSATSDKYDYILLIDVLYYERDIKKAWQIIQSNGKNGVIIRVPNKLWLIRSAGILKSLFKIGIKKEMADVVDYFNQEHIYIFKKSYIKDRLIRAGFSRVAIMPSRSLVKRKQHEVIENLLFILAKLIYFITFRKVIITPSLLVCAQKK